MKRAAVGVILLVLVALLPGCATVQIDMRDLDGAAAMTADLNRDYDVVAHFSRSTQAQFAFFDLVTIKEPEIQEILETELRAAWGDAITNITLKGQMTFVDGAISVAAGVLCGLIWPPYGFYAVSLFGFRTYTVEGDVIKYTDVATQ